MHYPARQEYPRPQFVRRLWHNLNGQWDFELDPANIGLGQKWFETPNFSQKIQVPFAYQAALSGVQDKTAADWCWYSRKFTVPAEMTGKQIILHFGAVDYRAWVYVNGTMVGSHEGGHTPFGFDITPYLTDGQQTLTLRVHDPLHDETIPRGKQSWTGGSHAIWYTPTTGIWQTVWLEAVEKTYLKKVRFTPDVDRGAVTVEATIAGDCRDIALDIDVTFKGEQVACHTMCGSEAHIRVTLDLYGKKIFNTPFHHAGMTWTPESPNLFDVSLHLTSPAGVDEVKSYFGLRKIHTEKGMVYLNNRPYYQKLVLDQGYWPGGLMTAPTDEAFKLDIELAKEMGFNGARKHQKVEDPRFLYWADTLGFLVWGECAAAPSFSDDSVARLTREWLEIVERDYNHPSIVTWVPFNESWGVPNLAFDKQQQDHTLGLYYTIKSLDTTRLVICNDGWEMTKTDICAFHTYAHGHQDEEPKARYYKESLSTIENLFKSTFIGRRLYATGYGYRGEPILLTEFGGIAYKADDAPGWGYTSVQSEDALVADYARLIDAIAASRFLHGYCYTQITDVEQEINGLLTYDRKPKCDMAKIQALNNSVWK